ncbi:uncharacterized protein VP01_962g3 [Puccinia sorghi]|uniref:CSC1/OSCA1-like 7TM region domain-containing protein n=1 Tax=Puccinia sorghi TaxID=27349 RepID=A0A0L6U655_9BASI|nr:uncharacterized protein VP01_962g3 [Puccinia sorghi]
MSAGSSYSMKKNDQERYSHSSGRGNYLFASSLLPLFPSSLSTSSTSSTCSYKQTNLHHREVPSIGIVYRLKHGNWFETQLVLSLAIGSLAFLTFCYSRARSTLTFAPRTHLSSFSPHPVHLKSGFFSWIVPTLKTSENTVLQIVGLDAVVLLYFFKLGFFYFLTCTIFAFLFLVPINIHQNGTTEGVPPDPPSTKPSPSSFTQQSIHPLNSLFSNDNYDWPDLTKNVTLYHCVHLGFTYFFSLLLIRFLKITYLRFIDTKPIFSLAHHSSIPLRTLCIENLPLHLQNDEALYEYFNDLLKFKVESVNVVRDVSGLVPLLRRRTIALINLEEAWARWLGNPVRGEAALNYHPEEELSRIIHHSREEHPLNRDLTQSNHHISLRSPANYQDSSSPFPSHPSSPPHPSLKHVSTIPRPTFRSNWFSRKKVDLIDHLTAEFQKADDLVQRRRKGNFRCHSIAFVTFKSYMDAQTLCQVNHWPKPGQALISLAPEPRDIYWSNLTIPRWSLKIRNAMVLLSIAALYGFWATPVTFVARWMSYDTLVSLLSPKLIHWIEKSPTIKALIQNSLPTLAIIIFNALLPLLLDCQALYDAGLQGKKSDRVLPDEEISSVPPHVCQCLLLIIIPIKYLPQFIILTLPYHIISTVFFIFVAVSTVSLLRDLRDNPAQFIDKIASSLPGARDFFISYLMLQSLAIIPLQLLQLPGQLIRLFYRLFSGLHTPRRHSEQKNMHLEVLSLGTIYPQALLVFTIGITYSVIAPIILVFGTIYFGMAYLVYKYKSGPSLANRLQSDRMGFDYVRLVFQVFMLGLLSLRQVFLLSTLVIPLILYTIQQLIRLESVYGKQSQFTSLSQLREAQRKEEEDDSLGEEGRPENNSSPASHQRSKFSFSKRLRKSSVTQSQTNLNVKRYDPTDETLFIPGETEFTDNREPPMSTVYWGILDTGTNCYAHPAISGRMPLPQLPVIRGLAPNKVNDCRQDQKRYELPQYRTARDNSDSSSGQSLRTLGKLNRRDQGNEDNRELIGLLDATPEVSQSDEEDGAGAPLLGSSALHQTKSKGKTHMVSTE